MRYLFIIISLLVYTAGSVAADTIIFKDGTRIEVSKAWEEKGEVKCKIAGVVIGYPQKDVKQIVRQRQSAYPRKLKPAEIEALARQRPGSCFDLGKRYGHCTTLSLYGEECPPQDDSPLPAWCKGRKDTENGMLDGIRLANKTLDLPPIGDRSISADNASVCFERGKRYGKCATLSMYAQTCNSRDNIAVPLDCRGKADTKSGMRAGVRGAYESLGFPTD
jgi:hypothetical protein